MSSPATKRAEVLIDPVQAYDLISPQFPRLALQKKPYLDSIDELIIRRVAGCSSLLDVGAGDGNRATRIASRAHIETVVLLEPSREMVRRSVEPREVWTIRAEELDGDIEFNSRRFDAIVCLWNVLGHIRPAAARVQVLQKLGSLLSPSRKLFLDVNHRYNARTYGKSRSALRYLHDRIRPGEHNGDVATRWSFGDLQCATYGHVFTDGEMRNLAAQAGLRVEEQISVDYNTGAVTDSIYHGNLFYVLTP